MKTIYLEVEHKLIKIEKDQEQDLLWYDAKNKILKKGRGGCLRFEFDMKEKRLIPYIEDVKTTSYKSKSNQKQIENWIEANQGILDISVNETESGQNVIAIDVSDSQEIFVKSMLDDLRIRYS